MKLAPYTIQVAQELTIVVGAPLVSGFTAKVEAILQGRRGPRILQPYYDLAKFFRKEMLMPDEASPLFILAPLLAFVCYLVVPLLIPVLTSFPLPLGYMGDILGGGIVLSTAGFLVALAGTETSSPYAQLGSSRAMTFGALIEPTVLFVVFVVGLITSTDLPYAMSQAVHSSLGEVLAPAHILAAIAFFMVVLADTGRIPIETHSGTLEFGMIEEARVLEHSGPAYAFLAWGSSIKQLILYTILIDVFVAPWGLSSSRELGSVLLAVPALLSKAMGLGVVFALVDNSFSKLRLFKIPEFIVAAFVLAVLAVVIFYLGGAS
ncbi:MAG: NADH-quinone oxidoreductase subunit H [Actinobacteria bacterium]|nr:NADH-quinone oxidoreductase subunit H [Actinomycetota bacterium]MCL6095216.1 NADH-quinone oxidoreductase subunit H [Actinomycetota bacterium]